MPTYVYRCDQCEHHFEVFQRITAAAQADCPQCASAGPKRQISGGTFHLKGAGWYASDYGGTGRSGTAVTQQGDSKPESCDDSGACGAPSCS
ncbi:MAG TPA: FmdB family transcriptional regulator [Myxococcales bacterium]|nr:FmdB family transcriptional regulator [Myxococcales bacterium]HAN32688.1 FmdB family transcriptional regulator [Myxococcales bacterium]